MKNKFITLWLAPFLMIQTLDTTANESIELQTDVEHDFKIMLQNLKDNYAYADQRSINWTCLKNNYTTKINTLQSRSDMVLFFEYFLLEFTDSHMIMNTNIQESYRLNSPIKLTKKNNTYVIDDYWQSQLVSADQIYIGAELLSINGKSPNEVIQSFPTLCLDKSQTNSQQWIINKSLAGKYSEPRIIELSLGQKKSTIDLNQLAYRPTQSALNIEEIDQFGLIKINNSLGQTKLIKEFDHALDQLKGTQGLVLDLRNTISGGDSYIAKGIISRLINTDQAYQKHRYEEHRDGGPKITRFWTEYVAPRGITYNKPMVVLVNHWTGSMGEGLAIGLHGMQRGQVIGSQMAGLLGAVYSFKLDRTGIGYQIPAEQLFHVDGTPREQFMPDEIIKPINTEDDAVLRRAIKWLSKKIQ